MGDVQHRAGVPAPPTPFVGRHQELEYLEQWVQPGRSLALVSEDDVEGVGRTALARAYADRTKTFGTQLWWSLSSQGRLPHGVLRSWAEALGVEASGSSLLEPLLDAVAAGLNRAGPALLVLDGVTTEDLDVVREVISARGPETAVLITGDEAAADQLGARKILVEPLLEEDGLALLEARVDSEVPRFLAMAVLDTVRYLPLGVVLAAARLGNQTAEDSTGFWGGRIDPARVSGLGGPPGVATPLLDVLRRLPDAVAADFRALGALGAGPVTAERLALVQGSDAERTANSLQTLERWHLVEATDDGVWDVHPLLRHYARLLADEAGELARLRSRRLSAVISAQGRWQDGDLHPLDTLDAVSDAIEAGETDDLVALTLRVQDALAQWSHEAALRLAEVAAVRAEDEGHRAAGAVRARRDALQHAATVEGDELELIPLEDDITDEKALDELGDTEVVSAAVREAAVAAASGGRADDGWFAEQGLLVPDDTDASEDEADADGATQIFDVGRLLSRVRGDKPEEERAAEQRRAMAALKASQELHERMRSLVTEARRALAEMPSAPVEEAFEDLVEAGRKLTHHVGRTKAHVGRLVAVSSVTEARKAADRAERARESVARAFAVVESAWTKMQDQLVEVVEVQARRKASAHRARRDVVLALQAVDDASRRLTARHGSVDGANEGSWSPLFDVLSTARERVDALRGEVDALDGDAAADPEDLADRAQTVRAEVEGMARDVLTSSSRLAHAARSEDRRAQMLRDVTEQVERLRHDAEWAGVLCDEVAALVDGHEDSEAQELSDRARRLRDDAEDTAAGAVGAAGVLHAAPEGQWAELAGLVGTAAQSIATLLTEAERLRSDADAWAEDHAEQDVELALAALHAEAATQAASVEAAAAVARRAGARAWQAAAHAEDAVDDGARDALRQAELLLREAVGAARATLDEVENASTVESARAAWSRARAAVMASEQQADTLRRAAEDVLGAADAARRGRLEQARDAGNRLSGAVEEGGREVLAVLAETKALMEAMGQTYGARRARVDETQLRVELADKAATDGIQRLGRTVDPAMAERIVDALHDASDVVSAAQLEAERLRAAVVEEAYESRVDVEGVTYAARASYEAQTASASGGWTPPDPYADLDSSYGIDDDAWMYEEPWAADALPPIDDVPLEPEEVAAEVSEPAPEPEPMPEVAPAVDETAWEIPPVEEDPDAAILAAVRADMASATGAVPELDDDEDDAGFEIEADAPSSPTVAEVSGSHEPVWQPIPSVSLGGLEPVETPDDEELFELPSASLEDLDWAEDEDDGVEALGSGGIRIPGLAATTASAASDAPPPEASQPDVAASLPFAGEADDDIPELGDDAFGILDDEMSVDVPAVAPVDELDEDEEPTVVDPQGIPPRAEDAAPAEVAAAPEAPSGPSDELVARREAAEDAREEALAAVEAARADIGEALEAAGTTPPAAVVDALEDAQTELAQAEMIVAGLPTFDDDDATWEATAATLEGRADDVARIAEAVRQATLSAREALTAAEAEAEGDVQAWREELGAQRTSTRAALREALDGGALTLPEGAPPVLAEVVRRVESAREALRETLQRVEALGDRIEASASADAEIEAALASLVDRADAEAAAHEALRGDLAASVATWIEHRAGRRLASLAAVRGAVGPRIEALTERAETLGVDLDVAEVRAAVDEALSVANDALEDDETTWQEALGGLDVEEALSGWVDALDQAEAAHEASARAERMATAASASATEAEGVVTALETRAGQVHAECADVPRDDAIETALGAVDRAVDEARTAAGAARTAADGGDLDGAAEALATTLSAARAADAAVDAARAVVADRLDVEVDTLRASVETLSRALSEARDEVDGLRATARDVERFDLDDPARATLAEAAETAARRLDAFERELASARTTGSVLALRHAVPAAREAHEALTHALDEGQHARGAIAPVLDAAWASRRAEEAAETAAVRATYDAELARLTDELAGVAALMGRSDDGLDAAAAVLAEGRRTLRDAPVERLASVVATAEEAIGLARRRLGTAPVRDVLEAQRAKAVVHAEVVAAHGAVRDALAHVGDHREALVAWRRAAASWSRGWLHAEVVGARRALDAALDAGWAALAEAEDAAAVAVRATTPDDAARRAAEVSRAADAVDVAVNAARRAVGDLAAAIRTARDTHRAAADPDTIVAQALREARAALADGAPAAALAAVRGVRDVPASADRKALACLLGGRAALALGRGTAAAEAATEGLALTDEAALVSALEAVASAAASGTSAVDPLAASKDVRRVARRVAPLRRPASEA